MHGWDGVGWKGLLLLLLFPYLVFVKSIQMFQKCYVGGMGRL